MAETPILGDGEAAYALKGRAAVVTGASGLIGSAIVRELRHHGMNVLATYRSREPAADMLAPLVPAGGGRMHLLCADLNDPDAPARVRKAALDEFGRIDAVVPVAGIKAKGLAAMTADATVDSLFRTNVAAVIRLCKACLMPMLRQGHGRLVLIGSRAGTHGLPGQAAYAASKAALAGWCLSLADEVGARGITVNLVSPGALREPDANHYSAADAEAVCQRIALRRLAEAGEVAAVVAFLCSAASSYISGANIAVDGGARF